MATTRLSLRILRNFDAPRAFGAIVFALVFLVASGESADARRYASIVVNATTGEVLHADKPNRQAYPASLTKMMTLYMVFEAIDKGRLTMDQRLKVSSRATKMPPSKLGLGRGQTISVRDAIMALVTKSANDVAVVVAESLGGSESNFAKMMTQRARELGMSRTTFRNASGLPNSKQLSTARDMVKLAQALLRHYPHHYRVFKAQSFTYRGRKYPNHNKLLKNYSGTDGIKTGYTHASGFNLVASSVRNGHRLIAVVFGGKTGKSRDRHMRKLLDKGFAAMAKRGVPAIAGTPPRKPGATGTAVASKKNNLDAIVAQVASGNVAAPVPQARPETGVGTQGAARIAALSQAFGGTSSGQGSNEPRPESLAPAAGPKVGSLGQVAVLPRLPADRAWGVQVGAYSRQAPAELAAREAQRKVPRYLERTHLLVSKIKGNGGAIYRARLLGVSESTARLACDVLKAKATTCIVVPPGQG